MSHFQKKSLEVSPPTVAYNFFVGLVQLFAILGHIPPIPTDFYATGWMDKYTDWQMDFILFILTKQEFLIFEIEIDKIGHFVEIYLVIVWF